MAPINVVISGEDCKLALRLDGYEFPESRDADDGNWISGVAELNSGNSGWFKAKLGVTLRTDELLSFRDELRELQSTLTGVATMHHLEGQVGCRIELNQGRGTITAFVKEHIGSELIDHESKTDQSYLAEAIRGLDEVLASFPIRGNI